jgi:hypothetical protein
MYLLASFNYYDSPHGVVVAGGIIGLVILVLLGRSRSILLGAIGGAIAGAVIGGTVTGMGRGDMRGLMQEMVAVIFGGCGLVAGAIAGLVGKLVRKKTAVREASVNPEQSHELAGAPGKSSLPPPPPRQIRLHVTADGLIRLDDRPVDLPNLEAALRSAYQPGEMVYYSRDNPSEDSTIATSVIDCVCRLQLPIQFPAEAIPTIDQVLGERSPPV